MKTQRRIQNTKRKKQTSLQNTDQSAKTRFQNTNQETKHKLDKMLNCKTQRRIQNTKQQNANQETKPKVTPKIVRDTFWTNTDEGFVQNPPVCFQNADSDFETQIFVNFNNENKILKAALCF